MKLISTLRIFVAILFLISPIDILCEKIPKYTLQNHDQRKLELNVNYIRVEYGKEATYKAKEFKSYYKQSIDYITYKGHIVDLEKEFTIEANTIIEIFFSEPITTLKYLFDGYDDDNCKRIKLIDLSHFNSSSVETTNSMFEGCSSLEEINFDNFDTSKVTDMYNMFEGCSNLKSLDLSNFNTSKVTDMYNMFKGCSNLKSLDLSNFDTSKVTSIVNMFYNCSSLEFLDISNFNTLNVIEYPSYKMFSLVYSLKYLNLYNVQIDKNHNRIKKSLESIIQKSTTVCQEDNIITDTRNKIYIYKCCDYNINADSCILKII